MTAQEVLEKAIQSGVFLYVQDEELKFRAKSGALTAELKSELARHRESIVRHLRLVQAPRATSIGSPAIEATPRFVDAAATAQTPVIAALSHAQRLQALPLSFAQTRIWFITRLEEGTSSYNIPAALQFSGPVSRESLRQAFEIIVARHAILRTVYREENREPVQVILEARPFDLPLLDLTVHAPDEQERIVRELVRSDSVRPFDLTSEPSLRVMLVRLSEENHILLFNVHHIAADGWSVGVLTRELNAIYGALRDGKPHTLPELPIQYCDYAVWQRETMAKAIPDEPLDFWKKRLAGIPKVHSLPLDRPRPAYPSYRGANYATHVDATVTRGLKELSRSHHATLFMILEAALAVLLHRYSGDSDVVIGTPVANRLQAEVEPLIGCFVNTLVLRSALGDDPRFTDFLTATHRDLLQAFSHQSVPFELLVGQLNPERDLSHAPLFQVLFVYQNNDGDAIALRDLKFERVESDYPVSKVDLSLYARPTADGLSLTWEYATDIFDAATIESMAGAFGVLLDSIVRTPEARVGALRLLAPEVEQELLQHSLGMPSSPAVAHCIHQIFEDRVRETPDAVAVRRDGDARTYRELNREANRLARQLRERGVSPGEVVGICVEHSPAMMAGLLAILKAGGAYLPIEAGYPMERLRFMLSDAGAAVVLGSSASRGALPADMQPLVLLNDAPGPGSPADDDRNFAAADIGVGPRSLAYVLYTSGSTGRPKGVAVEHRGVTRLVCDPDYVSLGPDTVTLQACAMSFDVATFELWAPLLNGGTLVLYDGPRGDVAAMARQVEAHGVNTLWLTSGLLTMWAGQHTPALGIRSLLAGGDVVPPRAVDEIHRRDPHVTVINGYGPTENTTFSCCHRIPRGPRATASVPIGKPIRGSSAYVLDGAMQLLPAGCRGELYVGGDGVAREYVGNPALTSERFVPNPFVPDDRLYKTGDVVRRLPDGTIEFLGRNDFQVKIRGFRIEIGEIENQLARVEGIADCVVVAIDRDGTGRQLVAYVVVAHCAGDLKERARRALRQTLPEYMVPAVFVVLDRMPITPHGKIDRRALPAPAESDVRPVTFAAPRTSTEVKFAGLWQEILRLGRVGIDDNFFEIGGHSLLALRFISAVGETFAEEIPMRLIFEKPTIRELATWLDIYNAAAVGAAGEPEGEELFL
jgi:amino acid adenylation domain-containing protein